MPILYIARSRSNSLATYSKQAVEFLDTRVIIDPDTKGLYITLYTKPTDMRDYLFHISAHPLSATKGGGALVANSLD